MSNIINALKKIVNFTAASPQRPRSMATKTLDSNEIKHLAKHIIKVTLWPNTSYCKGWEKEIRASLDNLAFKLCRYSNKINNQRIVEKLWYGPSDIMKRLNEELDDAYWEVMDEMDNKPSSNDPFIGKHGKKFSQIGYAVKQETDAVKGIFFILLKDGIRVI